MSREKQIEEIDELQMVLYEANHKKSVLDYRWLATEAYNAGYRKQSEGEWEQRTDVVGFVRCSVCKDCNVYDEWADGKKWNYCPHCGSKMKGENK